MSSILTVSRFKLKMIKDFHPFRIESPDPTRAIHEVARVETAFRTFVLLQDFNHVQDVWLNEFTGSSLQEIEDADLFHDLYAFLSEKGLIQIHADKDAQAEKEGGVRA